VRGAISDGRPYRDTNSARSQTIGTESGIAEAIPYYNQRYSMI
jgi:hypothetical protein